MVPTAEERDRLGRVAYEALPRSLEDWKRYDRLPEAIGEDYRQMAAAVRAAVLAGDPFVAALWRLARATYESHLSGTQTIEFQEAIRALVERPEWQQRQEQQP